MMKKDYKVILLILASEEEKFLNIETEGIRKTWLREVPSNIKPIFYYGNKNEITLNGDRLFLTSEEGISNCGKKTIQAFKFINEKYNYQFIFRSNISSYVDLTLLLNSIDDKPKTKFYDGCIGNYGGVNFCSGCGYWLSKDLVDLILNNEQNWDHDLIDDVALGKLLTNLNIKPYGKAIRFDVTNNEQDIDPNYYHYRCKDLDGNRKNDIIRMNKIHNIKNKTNQNG